MTTVAERNFQRVIDRARPDQWFLHCHQLAGDGAEDRELPWPEKGTEISEYLRDEGILEGRWQVQVERKDDADVTDAAIKSARQRLRKHGPMSTVVDIGTASTTAAPSSTFEPSQTARKRKSPAEPPLSESDPELYELKRQTIIAQQEAAKFRAELERRRWEAQLKASGSGGEEFSMISLMRQEFDRMRQQQDKGPGVGQIATVLAPIAQALITSMLESSARREELLMSMVASRPEGDSDTDSVSKTLPVMKDLFSFVKDIGGESLEDGSKGMLGEAADLVAAFGSINPGGVAPAMFPQPAAPGAARAGAQPAQPPSAEQRMQIRILKFLGFVQEFAEQDADPGAVAEQLYSPLGTLPGEFRDLVLRNKAEGVIAGLHRFMPATIHGKFRARLQSRPGEHQWLATFLEAMQQFHAQETGAGAGGAEEILEVDEMPDVFRTPHGQPVGPGSSPSPFEPGSVNGPEANETDGNRTG